MRRKILVPLVTILVVAFGGLGLTLATGSSPELGLDLQGGVSVVLAPTGEASGEQLDQALAIIRDRVDALGVAEPDITRQGDNIVVQLPGAKNRDRALALVGQTAELRFRPVLRASRSTPTLAEARRRPRSGSARAGGPGRRGRHDHDDGRRHVDVVGGRRARRGRGAAAPAQRRRPRRPPRPRRATRARRPRPGRARSPRACPS